MAISNEQVVALFKKNPGVTVAVIDHRGRRREAALVAPTHPLRVLLLLMVLAIGVNAPYLGAGYQADDLLLINLMRQDPLPWSRWRGPWSVWDIPAFTTLWWRDPDAVGAFWRPLPGLVFEGAVRLFGERQAFPLHLLALLLHGAVATTIAIMVAGVFEHNLGDSEVLAMYLTIAAAGYVAWDTVSCDKPLST